VAFNQHELSLKASNCRVQRADQMKLLKIHPVTASPEQTSNKLGEDTSN
jgi:hypothetical protein